MENALYLDSAVAIYALGDPHPLRESCRSILRRAAEGEIRAYASVEMIQELVHHRLRRTGRRAESAADGRDVMSVCTILSFDREIVDLSIDLIERIPTIRGRDAVHAATALAYGIDRLVSSDKSFASVPGVTLVEPGSAAGRPRR